MPVIHFFVQEGGYQLAKIRNRSSGRSPPPPPPNPCFGALYERSLRAETHSYAHTYTHGHAQAHTHTHTHTHNSWFG